MMASEEQEGEKVKPVFWIGSSLDDLRELPTEVRQIMGYALWQAQQGRKHVDAKPLKGFRGAGVFEIVAEDKGQTFRGVYAVKFAGVVYVLHAFEKKSKRGIKTPKQDINRIRQRLKIAEEHYKEWKLSRQAGEQK